jgi:hypothetical protein
MKQLDLFGGEIEVDQLAKEQNKKLIKRPTIKGTFRKFHGYNKNNKCKDCIYHIVGRYNGKWYHKCEKIGLSNSEATDIRLKDYACDLFEKGDIYG